MLPSSSLHTEDGDRMVLQKPVCCHNTILYRNPEDGDLYLQKDHDYFLSRHSWFISHNHPAIPFYVYYANENMSLNEPKNARCKTVSCW